jgi:hypothetical protein
LFLEPVIVAAVGRFFTSFDEAWEFFLHRGSTASTTPSLPKPKATVRGDS